MQNSPVPASVNTIALYSSMMSALVSDAAKGSSVMTICYAKVGHATVAQFSIDRLDNRSK